MLYRLRKVILDNRLYSWMLVFIILVQALSLLADMGISASKADKAADAKEFRRQLEDKQKALKELMEKNEALAVNLGIIFLFILAAIITGFIFLKDYIIKKRIEKIEGIPRTLIAPAPLWGMTDVFKVIILFLFFHNLFSLTAALLNSVFAGTGMDRRAGILVSTVFMDLLALMFVLHFVIDIYRQRVDALGISLNSFAKNIGVAIYAYIGFLPVLMVIFFIVAALSKALNYTPPPEPIYELIFGEQRPLFLAVIVVLISLGGPIIEEVFFRGFLYSALRKSFGIFAAISLSALLFSALHTNIIGFLPILALGIFLAYLREKTGSLIPSITVHVVHNTILASLMFLMRELTSKI